MTRFVKNGNEREDQRIAITPKSGFALVGIDYFSDPKGQLYLIDSFEMYQDALNAKKNRKNPDEYLVLYKDANGEYCYR